MGRLTAAWHNSYNMTFMIGSVSQFSRSGVPDSLRHHGLQHTRLPCPSPTPRACSDLRPLSWWCQPTISSSVTPSPSAFNLSWHQRLFQWDACFIFKNKMKINIIKTQPIETVHTNNRPREGMFYQITTIFNGELK